MNAESFGADTVLNQESLDFEAGHLNTLYNQYEACPKHPMGKGHGWFPTHQCKHCGKADEFMGISNIHEACPKHPMGKGHGWFNTNQCKHCGKVDEFMSAESFSADTECDDGCAWELGYVGKGASFGGNNEMNWDIHIYCPVCRTTLDFKAIPQDITGSPVANYFKGNKTTSSYIKERRKIYGEVCSYCGDQIDNPLDIKKGLCYWHQPENKEEILNYDKEYIKEHGPYVGGAESHAYSYAYNDGHSDSRKREEYRPNLSGSRQEADFKKILKQKAEYSRDSDGRFSSKSAISLTTAAIIGLAGAYLWRGKK